MPPLHLAPFALLFLLGFAGLWLAITGLLGWLSGWFRLQGLFPDRREEPILRLRFQSGVFGKGFLGANFGNCLTFDACPGGLRVGVLRLLGPFSSPFFVPWPQVEACRCRVLFGDMVELGFGIPRAGTMLIRLQAANRIVESDFLHLVD